MKSTSMSTALTNEYNLLHLLTEVRGDGQAVEHFVCMDCLELAEKSAETEGAIHECSVTSLWGGYPREKTST
ncbi:MAG TPA: hypothetical protein VMR52_12945 [Dehalococcoidia bacterium]|nr:hypothetical protein [Dehalococcoidia bacterium]